MKSLSMLFIVIFVIYSTKWTTKGCGPNEFEVQCAPLRRCQPSCEKPIGNLCPRMCDKDPCVCQPGFVRDSNNDFQCIEKSRCTASSSTTTPSFNCGPNEVAVECALLQRCQPSCENINGTICPLICSENPCVCQEGYIRDTKKKLTCVEKSQCTKENLREKVPSCSTNEEFSDCANPCQASCDEPNREPCPTLRCSNGCVCKNGYRRATSKLTSSCIICTNR